MNNIPKKIKLMADYQCWCLWDIENPTNIDPQSLPLSEELKSRLRAWEETFDKNLDLRDHTNIGFRSKKEFDLFYDTGWDLFIELKKELKNIEICYKDGRNSILLQKRDP